MVQPIGYDADRRTTRTTGPFGNGNETLSYDADGNRSGITRSYMRDTQEFRSIS